MSAMLVSILIPCYNTERWIAQCIESALAQTWPEKEVIVVNDGSTDGSLAVIQGFGDRIRWETGPNRGGNAARQRLLELARGEWLQYLDADDYLLPEKISGQVRFLKNHPDADVIYSPILLQDESSAVPAPVPNPHPINVDDIWIGLVRWHTPQTGGFLYRKQTLRDAEGWDPGQPCCQDNAMTLQLLIHGARFAFCPDAGAVYRSWSDHSVSRRRSDLVREHRLKIIQRAEDHLRQSGQLTDTRLEAVNQARFEIARATWPTQPEAAQSIVRSIHLSQRTFLPGPPVPALYRTLYAWFGFTFAEGVAALMRRMGISGQPAKGAGA